MAESLAARASQLQREVTEHKSAIKRHREWLGHKKAALVALEAEARRHGIALIVSPHPQLDGEGDFHGRPDDRSTP